MAHRFHYRKASKRRTGDPAPVRKPRFEMGQRRRIRFRGPTWVLAVLGGSCVVFNDVALPLSQMSGGQMPAQIPDTVRPGLNVVQKRSLATAQRSDPVVVTVRARRSHKR